MNVEEGNRKIAEWLTSRGRRYMAYDGWKPHLPRDFRQPEDLLRVLAFTEWDVEWWHYRKTTHVEYGYNVEISDPNDDNTVIGVASAKELPQALWEALVEAVDGGLGSEDA